MTNLDYETNSLNTCLIDLEICEEQEPIYIYITEIEEQIIYITEIEE